MPFEVLVELVSAGNLIRIHQCLLHLRFAASLCENLMNGCCGCQVVTMLLTAAVSAAAAIGYVGKKGNSHTGWLPVCNQFPKFCNHVTGALVLGFCGVLVYMFILLSAIHMVLNPLLL